MHGKVPICIRRNTGITCKRTCTADGLSLQSAGGNKRLTNADYIARAILDKPKLLLQLADEVRRSTSHNYNNS